MFTVKIGIKELILLSLSFTFLAIYLNIHEEKIVFNFIAAHLLALAISLVISRIIYDIYRT